MKPLAVFGLALSNRFRMRFFYDIFLFLYPLGLRLAAIRNKKAKQWINGRKDLKNRLKEAVENGTGPIIWFHCASLGEFEQGRPVIEAIKQRHPTYRILLTFFSPSGYETRKNYTGADMIFYLPMDGPRNSNVFIATVQPVAAVFIKYETWHYYLTALHERGIPALLIAAIFFKEQSYFRPWGGFMRSMLNRFAHIFTQDESSYAMLNSSDVTAPYSLCGDTRYDRVAQVASESFHHPALESFCRAADTVVAGSTWKEDEAQLSALAQRMPTLKFIIAPHEIGREQIERLTAQFENSICLSELEHHDHPSQFRTVIIDCIGLLSKLYRYATLSYVGGGFNASGIHNILEASAYGKVVVFGPQYSISNEAKLLIAKELAYSCSKPHDFISRVEAILSNRSELENKNTAAHAFVMQNRGATEAILAFMENKYFYIS